MNDLLFNLKTQKQVNEFLSKPSHALGLIGSMGAGKGAVATLVASKLLNLDKNALDIYPYFRRFKPEKGVTTIEMARELQSYLKLKTTGTANLRRVIIIEDAQTMTIEAQNALLKSIEEPPIDTALILTITSTNAMLPTINSRIQTITINPVNKENIIEYFKSKGYNLTDIDKYYLMSGGLLGLMQALLDSDHDHLLIQAIARAKTILQSDTFERLVLIDDIVKQKNTNEILFALSQISQAALNNSSTQKYDPSAIKNWGKILESTIISQDMIRSNAQAKLVLTNLFLNI